MQIGLRIDVDTFRGTRDGVPALCRVLEAHGIQTTFFFSVGPDNMGRHLWRLARPTFLAKMLRSRAASLYGWDILLRGTFWPGTPIGRRLGPCLRRAAEAGHEIGLHAWDHYARQARADRMSDDALRRDFARGIEALAELTGAPPRCAAAPGWRATEATLIVESEFGFRFNSDCRGESLFRPAVGGRLLAAPQVPVTLPTYDELIGRDGVTDAAYNDALLARLAPGRLNVLTIHAEVEGLARAGLFERFLEHALERGCAFVPLGGLVPADPTALPPGRIVKGYVPGRDGWVAVQAPAAGSGAPGGGSG